MLSSLDVKYWYANIYGDSEYQNAYGQAQTISFSNRISEYGATRGTTPSNAYIRPYALDTPIMLSGYLKLTFLNTTGVSYAAYRINKIRFNFA